MRLLLGGLLVYLLVLAETEASHDLFSSSDELKDLFTKEKAMKAKLEQYLAALETQIETIEELFQRNYHSHDFTEDDSDEYVSNPINTYVMLKRTGIEWPKVQPVLFNKSLEEDFKKIEETIKDFPKESDLEGAANGIFLLHETYNLNLTMFARGQLQVPGSDGKVLQGQLKLEFYDLELLGKLSFNRGYYDRAVEWMNAAIEVAKAKPSVTQETHKNMEYTLNTIKKKHDAVLDLKGPRGDLNQVPWRTYTVPFDTKLKKKKKYKKITHKRYRPKIKLFEGMQATDLWDTFNACCRGERLRTPEDDKDLKCQYIHYWDPYLRLGPFKIEEKNHAPFVSVFHDFIYDSEIDYYLEKTRGKLVRSEHSGKNGKLGAQSVKRTSAQIWLGEYEKSSEVPINPPAVKVTDRIKLATRLHASMKKGGEPYQVANYGIGGVYNHHTDSSGKAAKGHATEPMDLMWGDRIATTMGYLSDVTAGGATVFPVLGVTIWPKKGNLAFWYNNDLNGFVDNLTFHGGCPVLAGSKWITNKWIRTIGQWRNFPCSTSRDSHYKRLKPVNNDVCKMTHQCDAMDLFEKKQKYDLSIMELADYEDRLHLKALGMNVD